MKIVIPMPPRPKGRPRFANGHAYTPKDTMEYEEAVQTIARLAIKEPYECPLRLKITFFMPIPKSWSKAKKMRAMGGSEVPSTKPDIDNLCKAILDSLNGGIGYNDDKQVVEIYAEKVYSDNPRTEIELEEI